MKGIYLKRIVGGFVILAIIFGSIFLLDFCYVLDDDWSRIMWHSFYSQEENIDHVYIGASHVYTGLDPLAMDELNGGNNFNLSTPNQSLESSYYCLREADRLNELSHVYVELGYMTSTLNSYKEETVITNTWRVTDYMKPSWNKVDAVMKMNTVDYLFDAVFPFLRYREHAADIQWIKERVAYKQGDSYKNYQYYDSGYGAYYEPKGDWSTTTVLSNLLQHIPRQPEEMVMTEDAQRYLKKIILYCRERDIGLTLFVSPVYELHVYATENYDGFYNSVKEIADEYHVPFYDFNLVKESVLDIQHKENFMNLNHMNNTGSSLFTEVFFNIVNASPEDNDGCFYGSYAEKMSETDPAVYGIYFKETTSDAYLYKIASNRTGNIEYQISFYPLEGDGYIGQDFSENALFYLPVGWSGTVVVTWRLAGTDTEEVLAVSL